MLLACAEMVQFTRSPIETMPTIALEFESKAPGPVLETRPVDMRFNFQDYFGVIRITFHSPEPPTWISPKTW